HSLDSEKGFRGLFSALARDSECFPELRIVKGSASILVKPLKLHRWGVDPFSRGSYSYALPSKADCRAELAAPVDNRLLFAGEACSRSDYSTAHGAYLTGIPAAERAIDVRRSKR